MSKRGSLDIRPPHSGMNAMPAMQEASAETSLEERIAQINVKSCSVKEMTKLLWDITGEEKWVTRDYYQAFAVRTLLTLTYTGVAAYATKCRRYAEEKNLLFGTLYPPA
jgi:hypothetical protein